MLAFKMELFHGYLFLFSLCILGISGKINYNTVRAPLKRATAHEKKVIDKTCLLKPDKGPCRFSIDMFYFDPKYMKCSTFQWGGCQGNGNRYDTVEECMETCVSQPGRVRRPSWCALRWDYGFCFGDDKRWYYDKKWQTCKEVLYSGCGGNKNNFYSEDQCDSVCRFGNGPIGVTSKTVKYHKFLIINPPDSTAHRGLDQRTKKTVRTTIKYNGIGSNSRKDNVDVVPEKNQTSVIR